ncbi:CaiB/BaiF CoA-transferase family protein [Sphingomonas sp. LY54]|uniref:CaiB/BaiF CoA transferase family protein n=1 Tax=Sphingomonadales TaxID=204457 RepID=UPI002ADEC376|nr:MULTISPECIES: CaiB/BaiF CoA-transferase family protein [Sphingomonadales]MEA1015260.1 CaiB/BaiF CoA-transferase family protein [Sphingosinicella sp. LY1275]WRP27711.1 CaiB/BaiF CoA-transferase family protein [Sphingomonas sp. LY54]
MTAFDSPKGPLAGIRIVEIDGIGPLPLAGMILADMGADIIRVTRPENRAGDWPDVGGSVIHRNRRFVQLDLKSAGGRAALMELASRADVLMEAFRPGTMEKLGLGPESCHRVNQLLVYARLSGWGQDGPMRTAAGHDINYLALSGALHSLGPRDRPPFPPLNFVADYGGGTMFLISGILAALLAGTRGARAQVVDVAIADTVATLMANYYSFLASGFWSVQREANLLDGAAPFYRCYECADGRYVAVGALEPRFFRELLHGLGISETVDQHDPLGWAALRKRFSDIFITRPRDDWAALFAESDACVSPVLDMKEAVANPQFVARGSHHRRSEIVQPSASPRFTAEPPPPSFDPVELAAHEIDAVWRTGR